MSQNSKSLLCLLQRCVAVRKLPTCITTRRSSSVLSAGSGFTSQLTWTSTTRAVCPLQLAVRTSQYRFCTKAGQSLEDEYPPLTPYQPEPEPEKKEVYFMVVKGLPWSCSVQDLLQFFSECRILDGEKGIHLTVDRNGRPSGEAFIQVEHEDDVRKALEKHRQYLGPRYVQVYEANSSQAEEILKKAVQVPSDVGVVRIRGLPYTCTEDDIVQFFSGLEIVGSGITFIQNHSGKNSGEAFVQFSSKEAVEEALQKDRELIGQRYIEVFPSSTDQIYSSWDGNSSSVSPQTGTQSSNRKKASDSLDKQGSPHGHHIHMRGLPYKVSTEDIVKFFSPLVVSQITIKRGPDGRPNGGAEVYFSTHQDALSAMSRDRDYIGQRYVELFLNSSEDLR
ncbi:G-rich sequence factor 1-like isoform X2 [Trematomus bernacchii]|uniref:G-rich sequence factor 1-like isoform X2 n=1 Tax=Trematomus bernacchii TaxID=40690 RepID=UPI00146BE280|nr:G-rich sequence factor 1-like isoform X2 [Trematomus bernacchii]